MSGRAGSVAGTGRPARRRSSSVRGQSLDLDRARAAADRAVARVARPGGSNPARPAASGPGAVRPKRNGDSRPPAGARSTRSQPTAGGRSAPAGGDAPGEGRVRVVSSNPRRAAPAARARPAHPRRAPAPAPAPTRARAGDGLLARGRQAPGAVAHYFGHTPRTRKRTLPDKVTRARSTRRLTASALILSLVFSVVVARLVDLQVLNPAAYSNVARRMHRETLSADRGSIIDRNGNALALSVPATTIFVDGKVMADARADPRADASLLAPILEPDPARVAARAVEIESRMRALDESGQPARFTPLARQQPPEIIERVRAVKEEKDPTDPEGRRKRLAGVAFIEDPARYRPAGDVARSLVGDVTIDGEGIGGFERHFDDELTGEPGRVIAEVSPGGRTIAASDRLIEPAVRGRDVQLTIDRSMQYEAEQILAEQVRGAGAESGVAIVTKPDTGEILAMANVVADRQDGEVTDVRVSTKNSAMIDIYEPGSVMKAVTVAAALEEGAIEPDTQLPVSPTLKMCDGTREFGEAEPGHALSGSATVAEILEQSSNVGTIGISQRLGREALHRYLRSFGFGERTAIGFPDEVAGTVPDPANPKEWWCSSDGSVPIGQGVAVTPLQMLQAYNTIANGGIAVPSRLVAATIGPDGTRSAIPADPGRRVVSTETANELNRLLRGVITDGTGAEAAIPGYTAAGKTGTARRAQDDGTYVGEDGEVHYDATFAGFVPAEAPALTILVLVRDPERPDIYGGTVAGPVFARIGAAALRHFDVPPPSTDLASGGEAVAPAASDPADPPATADAGPPGSGLERTGDGRVRARPAGYAVETGSGGPASSSAVRGRLVSTTGSARGSPAGGVGPTTARARR